MLCYEILGGNADTVEMLGYIRNNVRTSFDMLIEGAINAFCGTDTSQYNITNLLNSNYDFGGDVELRYRQSVYLKQSKLEQIVSYFQSAGD